MKTERNINTDKKISKETALLIESLEYILKAENSALQAYWERYGEDGGEGLWEKSVVKESIEDLKQSLKLTIGDFMEVTMGEEQYQII